MPMKRAYDYIVIGCGGIGSAAAYWLSRVAGPEVLVLEQFQLGHDQAASDDHSKIIRLAYHAARYTALTPQTFVAWREVEQESGIRLVLKTGGLDLAPMDTVGAAALEQRAAAMDRHGIPYERLRARDVMVRWPQFRLPETTEALYQAEGGLVDTRKAIATHAALARGRGATILDRTQAREIRLSGDLVEVTTEEVTFTGRRVILAADAWTNKLLQSLGTRWPLTVTEEQVTYFATPNLRDFAPDRFPIWIWHGEDAFYGFPVYGEVATKAGQDVGGDVVTVDTRRRAPNPRPLRKLTDFLAAHIPGFLGPILYTKPCLYTMPPDRDFIIDRLPDHPQVAVAVGAGHAAKFSCLIGRILSQLAIDGETPYSIEAFRIRRPALTDRGFVPTFHY
jgi:sarcosine oxidase